MVVQSQSHFLIISGCGQNVGKTTLASDVILRFSSQYDLQAVKISPHMHVPEYELPLVAEGEGWVIYNEIFTDKEKDSSRFLQAGASRVFYVIAMRNRLAEMLGALQEILDPALPVVCESGGLAEHAQDALHIRVCSKNVKRKKENKQAFDLLVDFDGSAFNPDLANLSFAEGRWLLKK